MRNRKWVINLATMLSLLAGFFCLSGFYVDACETTVTIDEVGKSVIPTLYVADESTELFKAAADGGTGAVNVFVVNGTDATIPVKVYLTYEDGVDVAAIAAGHSILVDSTPYPVTTDTYQGKQVLSASFSLSYTAGAGVADRSVTISSTFADGSGGVAQVVLSGTTVTLKSAERVVCPVCHGPINYDGLFIHTVCPGCGEACVDGVIAHAACEACGATCEGSGIVHTVCPGCGEACVDGVVAHTVCPGCGEACVDGVIAHTTCAICGATCDGSGIVHGEHPAAATPKTGDSGHLGWSIAVMLISFGALVLLTVYMRKKLN